MLEAPSAPFKAFKSLEAQGGSFFTSSFSHSVTYTTRLGPPLRLPVSPDSTISNNQPKPYFVGDLAPLFVVTSSVGVQELYQITVGGGGRGASGRAAATQTFLFRVFLFYSLGPDVDLSFARRY